MATTTSFGDEPVQITAIDGSVARSANLTIASYPDLSVPAGATVNGIVVTWTGGYALQALAIPNVMTVAYAGSSNSSLLAANDTPANYSDISTVTYGSSTQLWGLTWTVDQANAISTKMFTESGTFYHDAFQVTIHYTASAGGSSSINGLNVSQGIINFSQGKITI